jgi:hypothetical protein
MLESSELAMKMRVSQQIACWRSLMVWAVMLLAK